MKSLEQWRVQTIDVQNIYTKYILLPNIFISKNLLNSAII